MTGRPETPEGNYLAAENASRPAAVDFCIRRGCVRYVTVPGGKAQTPVPVDCFSGQLLPEAAPRGEEILYLVRFRCGSDRFCLPDDLEIRGFTRALAQARAWSVVNATRVVTISVAVSGALVQTVRGGV